MDVQACFLGFLSRYDATYLMYAYKTGGKEYGFAWETYYYESHRSEDMEEESPWYDFIEQGQLFKIKVDMANPVTHFIVERPFTAMNTTIIQLGPGRDSYTDVI